jgi:hypothetical protein
VRKLVLSLLACLVWCGFAASAFADTPPVTGKAMGVDPSASAQLAKVTRTLKVGSDVSLGETVVTGDKGSVQLLFTDDTKLVVGPKSSLKIEAYLLQSGSNTASQFTVNALAGSYRFITGKSPKDAYKIETPTGIIGVRGTQFDFVVDDEGTTLVLFEGAVQMCNTDNQCLDLKNVCGVGQMGGDDISTVNKADQTRQNLRSRFKYVQSQSGLLTQFRTASPEDCLPPPAKPAKIVPPKITPPPTKPTKVTPPPKPKPVKPPVTKPTKPVKPTHVTPPPYNPCRDYQYLSRSEKAALARQGIYCGSRPPPPPHYDDDSPPSSLIQGHVYIPPPRRTTSTDGYGGSSSTGGSYGTIY